MSAMTKFIKYSLIVIDVIIFLSGLIMTISGCVIQAQNNSELLIKSIGVYSMQSGSIICIIFGLIIVTLSIFSIFSGFKDHYRFLNYFAIALFVIFVIQFITGVTGLSVRNSSDFDSMLEEIFALEMKINSTNIKERDPYQVIFQCCGWKDVNDYRLTNGTLEAPKSCCKNQTICNTSNSSELFTVSCESKIKSAFQAFIQVACAILYAAFFIFFSILLSCFLSQQVKVGYQDAQNKREIFW